MLELPLDVIRHLADWLPQHDLLHLAYTSKLFHSLLQPLLFHVIIVDSSRTPFDDIFADSPHDWFVYHEYPCEPTVIRTLYSLTRFLKVLIEKPHYGKYVKRLVVEELFPDMPELVLNEYLLQVFPCLSDIQELVWSPTRSLIDAQLLSLIPNHHRLQSLKGNFKFTNFQFPSVSFANLRHISISNFGTDKVLNNIDTKNFPSIESLSISKGSATHKSLFTYHLKSCCRSALKSSADSLKLSENPTFISSLFNSKSNSPLNLVSLKLKDISLTADDALRLKNHINLRSLKHLSLDNCMECIFETGFSQHTNTIRRRSPPANLFLDILTSELAALKLFDLSLSNELCSNRSTFNALTCLRGIEKLSIHIKVFKTEDQVNLAPLVNSLQSHATTLKYLNLCYDIVEASPVSVCPRKTIRYPLKSVMGLAMLKNLRVLKLPIELSKIPDLLKTLYSLTELRVLQLGIVYLDCAPSKSACFDCSVSGFVLGNANSLINKDYFACSTPLSSTIDFSKSQQYQEISQNFRHSFEQLKFVRFDLQNESLLYDVTDKEKIIARNSSLHRFDMIIKMFA